MEQVISEKLDLNNLRLASSLTMILKSRFASYRNSACGGYNFFRSLGISLLDYASSLRATSNFSSNLLSVLQNASVYLRLNQSNENAIKKFIEIISYIQHPEVKSSERLKFLESFYNNPGFDIFILTIVKILIAVAYSKFRDDSNLRKFIHDDLNDLIIKVLDPNNFLSENGNCDIEFLAALLKCSIKVLQVNSDDGIIHLSYNENQEDELYMIHVENAYHPLYTIEEYIYEEEDIEIRKVLLKTYKKISNIESQNASKEFEKQREESNEEQIEESNEEQKEESNEENRYLENFQIQSKNVFNLLFSQNLNPIPPEFLINMEILNENFKILEPQNLLSLESAISERQCQHCLQMSLLKIFIEKKKDYAKVYEDDCQDCLLENIRRNNKKCKECNQQCSELLISKLNNLYCICKSCNNHKKILKWFSGKLCEDHPRLCIECLEESLNRKKCTSCKAEIPQDKVSKLKEMLHKMCELCKKPYKRTECLDLQKQCLCNICPGCQSDKYKECVKCGTTFDEGLQTQLLYLNEDIKEQMQRNKARTKTCPICYSDKDISLVRMLQCNHIICEECLAMLMTDNIRLGNFKEASICPVENCKRDLGELIMRDVLSPELWNKWNLLVINKQFQIIACPRCREQFDALNLRRIQCLNKACGFLFCKQCNEEYHEEGNCEFFFIQNRIREMEALGFEISQCPGCKTPYLKDDHCDHVTCKKPTCGIDFCFSCACIRSPTLEHGNHYHRPECRFYFELPKQDHDVFKPKCTECAKLGALCPCPKRLNVPRKFEEGEV